MPVLSIDEAKLLATVLQKSFPEGKRPVPGRGKWLNHLARADGYRDWNVMVAAAHAQPPHLKWGEWGDLFVAIAWVEFPGCEPKFHMLATRDRGQAHPHNGWPGELAAAIGADLHRRLRGVKFHYGRPDVLRSEDNSWGPLAGCKHPVNPSCQLGGAGRPAMRE
ncbi:hypothetical protein, partial [Ralstonia pickettii]|uniref:hypothetical protein n=2 Tax=Ralstonia TaxID=48736 RepID=UPI002D77763C